MKWRVAGTLAVGLLFVAWVAGVIVQRTQAPPIAAPAQATRVPATAVPTTAPTLPAMTAVAVRASVPRLPSDIVATDETPTYTLTAAGARDSAEGRKRYAVDLTVPESYGRDDMVAVLRHAALWGLSVFPDANTLLVSAFTLPRNPSAGWTGQATVSRDGRGWSASDVDNGMIHITYSSLLEPTTKIDLAR